MYDFIKFAKKNKILVGPGRGSAAGSLVAYSLGITDIDPLKYDLLFERFLNPERKTMPDIDTDFPDDKRELVIDYVRNKYGEKRVSGIITFGTMAAKQDIRDVSRVLNIQLYKVEASSKFESIFKSKADVNKMVLTFIDDIVKKNYRSTDNIPENIEKMLKTPDSSDDDAAPIAWPIYPIENILRYFNDSNFEQENGFKHQAIQIQAIQGTPVYAARDGVVYYVSNSIDSISWVVIVHKN